MKKSIVFVIIIFYCVSCNKNNSSTPAPSPSILSFSPIKDSIGGRVTITGTNFSTNADNNIVKFNGVSAMVTSATATQLVVNVPPNASAGFITITVSGNTTTSSSTFKIISPKQLLLAGNWTYIHSIESDTEYFPGYPNYPTWSSQENTSFGTQQYYLKFSDSDTAYYAELAWGFELSGVQFRDTITYNIMDNLVILSYPSGENHYGTSFAYPAYEDTMKVTTLTAHSLAFTRYYHFKHYTYDTGEIKLSTDSLIK